MYQSIIYGFVTNIIFIVYQKFNILVKKKVVKIICIDRLVIILTENNAILENSYKKTNKLVADHILLQPSTNNSMTLKLYIKNLLKKKVIYKKEI